MAVNEFLRIHGLTSGEDFKPDRNWQGEASATARLEVPLGVDEDGHTAALDLGRWSSLDDHLVVVGAPRSGTTVLLNTIAIGLCLLRSPEAAVFSIAEGKESDEYTQLAAFTHCCGHIRRTIPAERLGWRYGQALLGEFDRRQQAFTRAGVTTLNAYRALVPNPASESAGELPYFPEHFVVVDNISWILGTDAEAAVRQISEHGHRLGIRLLVGVPHNVWVKRSSTGLFDSFSARIVLGLDRHGAGGVLGTEVPSDLGRPGDAYLRTFTGELTRFAVAKAPY